MPSPQPTTPLTPAHRPAPDVALALYRRWFLNRTDVVAFRAPWGKPQPVRGEAELDALLRAHLLGDDAEPATYHYKNRRGTSAMKGRFRLGSYAPGAANTTRWVCLDFDGTGHAEALADPLGAARRSMAAFREAGVPAYLERSGGGHGWHVWAFFEPEIAAEDARALGRAMAPKDAVLADGGIADARSARGIEVFPKQARVTKKGFGNLVWLPWWREAAPGASLFYAVREDGSLAPCVPTFEACGAEALTRALAAIPPDVKPRGRRRGKDAQDGTGVSHDTQATHAAAPDVPPSPTDPVWVDWRARALAALPLESVYGRYLTGEASGPGWLQCREPTSASGDEHPSAGVADGSGEAERGDFHSFLTGRTISVFDFLVEHGEAADFKAARTRVAELSGVPLPNAGNAAATTLSPPSPTSPTPDRALPRIRVNNRQLRDVFTDAWRVLHRVNTRPSLFLRAGQLVRLGRGEAGPRIESVEETVMYGHLIRIANWVRVTEDAVLDTTPPKDVARDMLVNPEETLPQLEAVVSTPVFDAEGRLVSTAGYHRDARLWLHEVPDLKVPPVPGSPTAEDVAAARSLLLDELLVDFPFAAESDRAHAVAALLLPFVRRMVSGCTPIHLLEAPSPGSGKGLLADVIAIVAMGKPCDPTTITPDEDEARKKLTSILSRAQSLILLDNVKDGLDSAQLASALTAETWSDRLLGQTKMIDLPNRATWLVTANNPTLSLELARRCVRIRIDPKCDRPWKREGFHHDPLRDWVRENRGALVHAVLVLVRSWIAAGRPRGTVPLGSFESWAGVIGGILANAHIGGFLGDAEELYEHADTDGQAWRALVAAWWQVHGSSWVASGDLLPLLLERDLFGHVLGDKSERSQRIRLGRALGAARDRLFGEFRLLVGRNTTNKTAQYRLERTGTGADDDERHAWGPGRASPDGHEDPLDDLFPVMSRSL